MIDLEVQHCCLSKPRSAQRTLHLTTPTADFELAENDPWGTPYRVMALPNGGLRVLSCGSDQTTPRDAPDKNDLYSDMPTNPARDNFRRKQRKILTVLGIAVGTWLCLSVWYLRKGWRPSGMQNDVLESRD